MLDRAVRALGAGIASAANVLDVEGVIIGGGLGVRLGHPYAKRIAEEMLPHLFADFRPPQVHVAALGDLGGAIGAALLLERDGSVGGLSLTRWPAGGTDAARMPTVRSRSRARGRPRASR